MKIGVGTLIIGDKFKEDVKYGHITKVMYCQKHGYDLITDESVANYDRHLAWSKVYLILKYLSSYDYFVWIDADTVITNLEKKLEDFIPLMQGKHLMYAASDNWVNTGVMFIKNTQFCRNLFTESLNHTDKICWEQGSIDYLWRINWCNSQQKIQITKDRRTYNSLWREWEPGQFLVHFPGCGEKNRPKDCLKRMIAIFYPYKMDEETDEEYQSRMKRRNKNFLIAIARGRYFPLD